MRALLLLPLLLTLTTQSQNPPAADDKAPVVVVAYKWLRDRQPVENAVSGSTSPAPAMIAANKNFERQRRVNASPAERDPNIDTIDGRSAAIDRIVDESRAAPPVEGFAYQVKVHNAGTRTVVAIFWEYRFTESARPANIARRQFMCSTTIEAEKHKEFRLFSLSGPSDVIDVKSLGKNSGNQFQENVLVNRVEYADGSFWQRKDWNYDVVNSPSRTSTGRETRSPSACRGL